MYNSSDEISLLLIDDDKKFCRLLKDYLTPHGYTLTISHTGQDGLDLALTENFHLVILDVMLPGIDGFEVLKRLRHNLTIPVLMFTSRGDEVDRIVGLEMGADDYLPKTFSSRELLARLRAVIRRVHITEPKQNVEREEVLQYGQLTINTLSQVVMLNSEDTLLTPAEYRLLNYLAQNSGRVLSRDQLMEFLDNRNHETFDRIIDNHISSIRRKIKDDPKSPKYIKTVRSTGYMFIDSSLQKAV
ncbi:winged helix-turn-helix domain-containing protein [Desulfosediminicola ganghwensis]|uniref:winged helix-turn-helix domain-containing protein n=1 Tax=Desulfosediminicola ganghwensis TaxID=2569540 RepID=UPI0010AB62F6|nr:response regulator transcription factor [Desulfosediminicola ganghwensis]